MPVWTSKIFSLSIYIYMVKVFRLLKILSIIIITSINERERHDPKSPQSLAYAIIL